MKRPPIPAEAVSHRLLLDTRPYVSCDECFERIDSYVEALIRDPGQDDPPMRTHLSGCPACAEEAEGLLSLLIADMG